LSDHALAGVVAEVARHAAPGAPSRVTQAAWDAARADAGHADAPTARAIVMRLASRTDRSVTWRAVLEAALDPHDPAKALSHLLRQRAAVDLTERDVRYGLRAVARHLDSETFGPGVYDEARQQLLRATPAAGRAIHARLLPTATQIQTQQGSWPAAMRLAGLTPPVGGSRPRAMDARTAIEHYVSVNDELPTLQTLRRFMTDCNAALRRLTPQSVRAAQDEVRRTARANGRQLVLPPRGSCQAYVLPELPLPGSVAPRRQPKWGQRVFSREDFVEVLMAWDASLAPGEKRTRKAYQHASAANPQWPSPATMDRNGYGFKALRDEALRRNRSQ